MARSKKTDAKTEFVKQLEAATGVADAEAKAAQAEEHFDRRVNRAERLETGIATIRPMQNNPREKLGDISALVKSIEANGFVGALSVRELAEPDGVVLYEVWAGNRRLAAAKEAGLTTVPVDIYELSEVQALELNLTEQINRSDLSPLEEGEACRALMELSGYSRDQVAAKLGQSPSWVTKRLALCGLAAEVKRGLKLGEVSLTVAAALAALPAQKAQVDALKGLNERPSWEKQDDTAENQVDWIRNNASRPLSRATWKLTDDALLPEAGACSACPHNSANARMPGLFDAKDKAPSCANIPCFEDKLKASWEKKSAKARAAGAKVLSLGEGKKLFPQHSSTLPYGSRYVEADTVAQDDKKKRSWKQLMAAVAESAAGTDTKVPVLHVAQDSRGFAREMYVRDDALRAIADVLELKWAQKETEAQEERREAESPEKRAEDNRLLEVREQVQDEVLDAVAAKLAAAFPLWAARDLTASVMDGHVARLQKALGAKGTDWLEKKATLSEHLALLWLADLTRLSTWDGFDERLVKLAKDHGFDLDAMVKAALKTEGKAA